MQLQKAQRKQAVIKLALQGPSVSGKTYSSLLLAFGLVSLWEDIAVIDTENNSSHLYSHLGNFNFLSLSEPFSHERYIDAIEFCEKAGMRAIIIDSISQEWEGSGGIIETHGNMAEEHFKVFIGFRNHVCINLCISTDGFLEDLRVMSVQELFNCVFQLLTRFDAERQLNQLKRLSEYALTEHQFAQLIGRSRLYNYLPPRQKKDIEKLPLSDTQISIVAKDYCQDKSFCRSEDGGIDMWKVYNLFTSATKSSYIDTFIDRTTGSLVFITELISHLRSSTRSWYLS
jgi:hypothetical protein